MSGIDRRSFMRNGVYMTSAAMLAASGIVKEAGATAKAARSNELPFTNLTPQTSMGVRADAYGETCVRLARLAAMTTRCQLDIAYGEQPQQRLDLWMPDDESLRGLPVFINLHGGGWTHGRKEWMGVNAPAIVRFPAIQVAVEYGLRPTHQYPQPLRDCLAALSWVHKNIATYGGDPKRIFIGGHSAGAHLSALTTLRRDLFPEFGLPDDVIKACFPYSGVYDLRELGMWGAAGRPVTGMVAQGALAPEASPALLTKGNRTPFFVTWSENDNPLCLAQSPAFVMMLRKHGARAEAHQFPLFDHFWIHLDQADPNSLWTRTLQAWMTDVSAR